MVAPKFAGDLAHLGSPPSLAMDPTLFRWFLIGAKVPKRSPPPSIEGGGLELLSFYSDLVGSRLCEFWQSGPDDAWTGGTIDSRSIPDSTASGRPRSITGMSQPPTDAASRLEFSRLFSDTFALYRRGLPAVAGTGRHLRCRRGRDGAHARLAVRHDPDDGRRVVQPGRAGVGSPAGSGSRRPRVDAGHRPVRAR